MTLNEYLDATKRYGRFVLVTVTPLVGALLCVLVYMPFLKTVESMASIKYGDVVAPLIAVAPLILIITAGFAMMALLLNRVGPKYDVLCEHCGQSIAIPKMIVVASKHCPQCGQRVISEA